MESNAYTVTAADLAARIRQRLVGVTSTARQAIWQSGGHSVLLHAERLQARLLDGWLLVGLELETEQTGRALLEFVFHLGAARDGDGLTAAVRINAATRQATQLAELWGDDLQRVIWDAVLDTIQLALRTAIASHTGQPIRLRGFHATANGLHVDVATGVA